MLSRTEPFTDMIVAARSSLPIPTRHRHHRFGVTTESEPKCEPKPNLESEPNLD